MAVYRDEAVVLRTQRLGEADRIVSLLTRRHGRVRAVAKGVRRTKSKFGARLEPGTHVDLQLYEGRSLDVVTQAETLAPYGAAVAGDYGRHTAEFGGAGDGRAAVGGGARAGAAALPAPRRGDAHAGGGVARRATGRRRVPAAGARRRRLRDGAGRVCPLRSGAGRAAGCIGRCWCRPGASSAASAGRPARCVMSEPAVRLLTALAEGDWEYADASDGRVRREASGVVAAHLQWHLERGLRSLALVEGR